MRELQRLAREQRERERERERENAKKHSSIKGESSGGQIQCSRRTLFGFLSRSPGRVTSCATGMWFLPLSNARLSLFFGSVSFGTSVFHQTAAEERCVPFPPRDSSHHPELVVGGRGKLVSRNDARACSLFFSRWMRPGRNQAILRHHVLNACVCLRNSLVSRWNKNIYGEFKILNSGRVYRLLVTIILNTLFSARCYLALLFIYM